MQQEKGEGKEKKFTVRQIIFLLLVLVWMAVIFRFSARNADLSTEDSVRVGRIAAEMLVPSYEDMTPAEQYSFALKIDHPVRKTAHATEYLLLCVFLTGALMPAGIERIRWKRHAAAWGVSSVYAVTDEIHQIFVPGRSCEVKDMLIDSSGAALGMLLSALFLYLFCIRPLKKMKMKNPEETGEGGVPPES